MYAMPLLFVVPLWDQTPQVKQTPNKFKCLSWFLHTFPPTISTKLREAFQTKKRGNLGNGPKW